MKTKNRRFNGELYGLRKTKCSKGEAALWKGEFKDKGKQVRVVPCSGFLNRGKYDVYVR